MQVPVRVYRSRRLLAVGLVLLNAAVIGSGAALAARVGSGEMLWFVGGVACGVASLAASLLFWWVSGRRLVAYPEWFHVMGPHGGFAARWDQVDGFYAPPAAVTGALPGRIAGHYEYRLVVGDRTIGLGLPIGADRYLGEMIDEATRPAIRERAAGRLRAGRRVEFGPLTLGADGLTVRRLRSRTVPFDDLKGVELRGSRLVIRISGAKRPATVPISRVPSVKAVVDLVETREEWMPHPKAKRGSGITVLPRP